MSEPTDTTPEVTLHAVGEWAQVAHGEALATLRCLPDESVDALVREEF